MATKYEQELVSQYGSGIQDYINQQRTLGKSGALRGSNVDKQDVQRIVAGYQAIAPVPTPQTVYSTDNIQNAVSAPSPTPNLADPMGIYDYYLNTPEVLTAQQEYQKQQSALQEAQSRGRSQQAALEGNLESMSRITGRQSRAGQLSNIELQSLAEQLNVSQSRLEALTSTAKERAQIAMSQRDQLTQLITQYPEAGVTYADTVETASQKIAKANERNQAKQIALQYPKAGIKETDTYDVAIQKIQKFEEKQEQEAQKKIEGEYKKQLQATARELGISTKTKKGGTMSTKQLEDAIGKENKKALAEAKAWEKEQMSMERAKFNKSMTDVDKNAPVYSDEDFYNEQMNFYKDVDYWKKRMEEGSSWNEAWRFIQGKYGFDPNNPEDVITLDNALGLSNREVYDK
jgi:hypothetical protein